MFPIDHNQIYGVKPFTNPIVAPRLPLTDSFMTQKIGHTHVKIPSPLPFQKKYMVQDFIFESTQTTGTVNVFDSAKQFSLNTTNEYALIFFADMDKTFVVKMPKNATRGFFNIYIGRELKNRQLALPGFYDSYSANIQFGRIKGNVPFITYNHFAIQNGYNGSLSFNISGEFTTGFSFDYIAIEGKYPTRMFLPSFEEYTLFSDAMPFGIQSNDSVAFAMFGYDTDEARDPGPIIRLKNF